MSIAVIYTDLDGTLLDHHTYSFEEALETVHALRDRTYHCALHKQNPSRDGRVDARPGLTGPMIVENGAAIWVPSDRAYPDHRAPRVLRLGVVWSSRGMIRRQLAILSVEWGNRYNPSAICQTSRSWPSPGWTQRVPSKPRTATTARRSCGWAPPPIAPPLQIRSRRWTVCKARGSFMCWVRLARAV